MDTLSRIESMDSIIRDLEGKLNLLATSYDIGVGPLYDSIDETQRLCAQSIKVLKGTDDDAKNGGINAYEKASNDDVYFTNAWAPLAQQTGENLSQALGYTDKYDVVSYYANHGAEDIYTIIKPLAPSNTSLGIVAVIVVALAVIMVFK